MRISDWSSDVCSSDLDFLLEIAVVIIFVLRDPVGAEAALGAERAGARRQTGIDGRVHPLRGAEQAADAVIAILDQRHRNIVAAAGDHLDLAILRIIDRIDHRKPRKAAPACRRDARSEEHTSELQSLMRNSYA